jgi:hypothetical protein
MDVAISLDPSCGVVVGEGHKCAGVNIEDNYCHHFSSTRQTQSSADRKEREQKEETDESKV